MKPKILFQVSASSGVPIYRQIMDQVKTQIATGRLEAGLFLPSVRLVAEELEVNPMTVSKAYSLLEKENVLEFVRGQGMVVRASAVHKKDLQKKEDSIVPLLKEVVIKAKQLSIEQQKISELLQSLWKEDKHG